MRKLEETGILIERGHMMIPNIAMIMIAKNTRTKGKNTRGKLPRNREEREEKLNKDLMKK